MERLIDLAELVREKMIENVDKIIRTVFWTIDRNIACTFQLIGVLKMTVIIIRIPKVLRCDCRDTRYHTFPEYRLQCRLSFLVVMEFSFVVSVVMDSSKNRNILRFISIHFWVKMCKTKSRNTISPILLSIAPIRCYVRFKKVVSLRSQNVVVRFFGYKKKSAGIRWNDLFSFLTACHLFADL